MPRNLSFCERACRGLAAVARRSSRFYFVAQWAARLESQSMHEAFYRIIQGSVVGWFGHHLNLTRSSESWLACVRNLVGCHAKVMQLDATHINSSL